MRRLTLAELQKEHRGVQVSDMGAINEWISQSTEGEEGESDDEEDLGVSLKPGERHARHLQVGTPDEQGFYDCNPDD